MNFLTRILGKLLPKAKPRLRCDARVWRAGVLELNSRTAGVRESGAFLLGRDHVGIRSISEFLFYDDIDPNCFDRGIVEFNGRLLGQVWATCRAKGFTVVADVH